MAKQPSVNHLLERAVVKVLIGNEFKGTGFFISPDYLLTAYHCLGDLVDEENLFVENQTYGRMRVILDRDKSFPSQEIDIAVLKLVSVKIINDYLPVGLVTENHLDDEILAAGYPLEDWSLIRGHIQAFPKAHPHQFLSDAMQEKGQSGGAVYHIEMRLVVGIALNLNHRISRGGLAGRFDKLFQHWHELNKLNQQAIDDLKKRLNVPLPECTHQPIIMQVGVTANHYKVDRLDSDKKLRENAKLLEGSDDPEVNQLLRQAREFTEGKDIRGNSVTIDFDKADVLLEQAFELEQQGIMQLHEIEEKAKASREKKQLSAAQIQRQKKEIQRSNKQKERLSVEIIHQRAIMASIQSRNADAIRHYRQIFSSPHITDFSLPYLKQPALDYAASINIQKSCITSLLYPKTSLGTIGMPNDSNKYLLGTTGLFNDPNRHLPQYLTRVFDKHLSAISMSSDSNKYLLGTTGLFNDPNKYLPQCSTRVSDKHPSAISMSSDSNKHLLGTIDMRNDPSKFLPQNLTKNSGKYPFKTQ